MTPKPAQLIQFKVNGYTFPDSFFAMLYSEQRMAKRVAIKSMQEGSPFHGRDPSDNSIHLVITFPGGTYRIMDSKGTVERYLGQLARISL